MSRSRKGDSERRLERLVALAEGSLANAEAKVAAGEVITTAEVNGLRRAVVEASRELNAERQLRQANDLTRS